MLSKGLAAGIVGAIALFGVVGCGGDDGGGEAQGSSGTPTLKVTNIATELSTLPMFVAQSRGLFEQEGVKVEINSGTTTNQPAMLSSGESDLIYNSNGVAIGMALKDRPAVSVYGLNAYSYTMELWGAKSITSLDELRKKDKCTFATTSPGGATYGYSQYWTEKYDLKCDVVVANSNAVIVSGLQGGSYDVGMVPRSGFPKVPDGINVLIAATKHGDPSYPQVPGGDKAEIAGMLGMRDNLEKKRDAVTGFVRGLVAAQKIIDEESVDQLVPDVQKSDIFKATPPEQLKAQITSAKQSIWRDPASDRPGYISEEVWKASLQAYSYWGIEGFKADDPRLSYDELIDMSFYDAAAPTR